MHEQTILPIYAASKYYELIMEKMPDGAWVREDASSFRYQVSRVWQREPIDEATGMPIRNREREFFVYITAGFILYVYSKLAYEPECHTNWVNRALRDTLTAQLSNLPEIIPALIKYNKLSSREQLVRYSGRTGEEIDAATPEELGAMAQEIAGAALQELDAGIRALEARFELEQAQLCESGYRKGVGLTMPNEEWPVDKEGV